MKRFIKDQESGELITVNDLDEADNILNRYSKDGKEYSTTFGTFDIETTSFKDFGIMYLWGMCIGEDVIIGRRWEEVIKLFIKIEEYFDHIFVIYCHNLEFEFQFYRNFATWTDVFSVDKRKVIRARTGNLEFRCSYKLSNMSLEKFCEAEGAIHSKKSGEKFDYKKIRYPWTPLSDYQILYQYCDVKGLHESIERLLKDDDLSSIPMTSTGYVRRDCRKAVLSNPHNRLILNDNRLDLFTYTLLRTGRRGGDTHASVPYSNEILENVDSYDKISSYPYEMMTKKFPMGQFIEVSKYTPSEEHCYIMMVRFNKIRVKSIYHIPYIPFAKCSSSHGVVNDNGRILKADDLSICITELDYALIEDCYKWDNIEFIHILRSRNDYLPVELRKQIWEYGERKTALKGKDRYFYTKSKNKLNGIFGMMLTDICQDLIIYDGQEWKKEGKSLAFLLNKYYNSKKSFLSYQWGVWVTAWARYDLHELYEYNRRYAIYSDTDSWKLKQGYDKKSVENINNRIRSQAEQFEVKPYFDAPDGHREYLGIWEYEGTYEKFKTLGAKKYCYIKDGELSLTVSGLSKEKGRDYLLEKGGIEAFKDDLLFPEDKSGRTFSVYHDVKEPYYLKVEGHEPILCGSSIAIHDTTYTLGITSGYDTLVKEIKKYPNLGIDKME